MIKLNPHQTHRFTFDTNHLALHTKGKIEEGDLIQTDGKTEKVKRVIRAQVSSIYAKNLYYEIEVYGSAAVQSPMFYDTRKKN